MPVTYKYMSLDGTIVGVSFFTDLLFCWLGKNTIMLLLLQTMLIALSIRLATMGVVRVDRVIW